MSLFDIVLLIIFGGFAMFGFWFGFIHTLGSLFGTVFGAYLASRYYEPMAAWLGAITGWEGNATKVVMFIIAFLIINRLVGLVFWFVEKILKIVTRLPFLRSLDRLLGSLLGLFEGMLTLGLIFYFIDKVPLSEKIMGYLATSEVAPYTINLAKVLLPLLPDALKALQSTVDFVEAAVT